MLNKKDFKLCKNCSFYSGIECHGHGDFWGTCNIIFTLPNRSIWESVVYDDTQCKVKKKEIFIFCQEEIIRLHNEISSFEELLKKYEQSEKE